MKAHPIIEKLDAGIYWDMWTATHITGETETAIIDAIDELELDTDAPLAVQYLRTAKGQIFFCIRQRPKHPTLFLTDTKGIENLFD